MSITYSSTSGFNFFDIGSNADKWEYCAPVGSFKPNYYRVFDIMGNVWEFTLSSSPLKFPGPIRNPIERASQSYGKRAVVRGDAWTSSRFNEYRVGPNVALHFPRSVPIEGDEMIDDDLGFRCVINVDNDGNPDLNYLEDNRLWNSPLQGK